MNKIMKIMLVGLLTLTFVSCGTIMEKSTKHVTVTATEKSRVFYNGELVGTGKYALINASNRAKGQDQIITVESLATGERRNIYLEYEMNAWSYWGALPYFWIGIPVDLISGGYKRLERTNYYVEFDENYNETLTTDKKATHNL